MTNETNDKIIQRLQTLLTSLQNHARNMDTLQQSKGMNVAPIFGFESISLSRIEQAMKDVLYRQHTFNCAVPKELDLLTSLTLEQRTNDDLTLDEFTLLRPFLPSDFFCEGNVSSLPNITDKIYELERQILFLCMFWQGTAKKMTFHKNITHFPITKDTTQKEIADYDKFYNLWIKAARQAPSYLIFLKQAYLSGKKTFGELYFASQAKSRSVLVSDARKIVGNLLLNEILSLYHKHSFLFAKPITRENALEEVMKSDSSLRSLYTSTLGKIEAVSSLHFRSPEYLLDRQFSLESFSSGSLTSFFRRKSSSSVIKREEPAYSIVEMRDYLGVKIKHFIGDLNEFSFLSCLKDLGRERFDKWIVLKAMVTSELDAMLFNLSCDIKFTHSLINEHQQRSYLGKIFSTSLYSLHRRQQRPSDVIAIKTAAYHKIKELLEDMNDSDPNKSLNPVKIFSQIQMILGYIHQEPDAVKVLASMQSRLQCLAKEMTNLPLTPVASDTNINRVTVFP